MSDPYRTAPERPPEPELDRLPVYLRGGLIRGGEVVVTPTQLVFEPRFGGARGVPIEQGFAGLALSAMFEPDERVEPVTYTTYETVYTWMQVTRCAAYQQGLSATPHAAILDRAYLCDDGVPDERTSYVVIIDGDRAHVIHAGRAFEDCFELPASLELTDISARTLARALRWLPRVTLARIAKRVKARAITLDDARRAPPLRVEGRNYLLVSEIAIELVRPQIAAVEKWLATPSAPP